MLFFIAQRKHARQGQQLDCISQFKTTILYGPGEENTVADPISAICTITMPTKLDTKTISEAQGAQTVYMPDEGTSSLKLQPLQRITATKRLTCSSKKNLVSVKAYYVGCLSATCTCQKIRIRRHIRYQPINIAVPEARFH